MATVLMDSMKVVVLDIRYATLSLNAIRGLVAHQRYSNTVTVLMAFMSWPSMKAMVKATVLQFQRAVLDLNFAGPARSNLRCA